MKGPELIAHLRYLAGEFAAKWGYPPDHTLISPIRDAASELERLTKDFEEVEPDRNRLSLRVHKLGDELDDLRGENVKLRAVADSIRNNNHLSAHTWRCLAELEPPKKETL